MTTAHDVVGSRAMKPAANEQNNQPLTDNSVRTAYEEGIPMALVDVHGDKWCVFGDDRVPGFMDNSLLYSKREVFGFPLVK